MSPHIALPEGLAGIRSLMTYSPRTAKPLNELAEALLVNDDGLSAAERELIATFVSAGNDCHFCRSVHGSVAAHRFGDAALVDAVARDHHSAPISPKLKALLDVAAKVRLGGREVSAEDIERARAEGASDQELHDTVLIAAAFCMFNRYVDGLATWAPADPRGYDEAGPRIAREGYANGTLPRS